MIFSSFQFLLFLLTVMALLVVVPGQNRRKLILLLASYFFYGYWDYRFVILIWISTIVDAILGKAIFQSDDPQRRKIMLIMSLCANLGILGFFKYFNFFIDSAAAVFGLHPLPLSIILPVGISFYTFQTMSYTIDIYRGTLEPADTFLDFALFVAFFPQLVAGPIVRASEFLPQLRNQIAIRAPNIWMGAQIFTVGLFKKLILADHMALFVDGIYSQPQYFSSATVWLGVLAYSIQIYCDFSGYSDMAIGIARMLGFQLPQNFNMPYISTSLTEFWRRWHITLSTWLRDYLYIPLGGNRKGNFRTYVNLMITMLLGGLWHGASWNFVVWGGAHGLALSVNRFYAQHFRMKKTPVGTFLAWLSTFTFVTVVWVFFRSPDPATTSVVFQKLLFINSTGAAWYYHWFFIAAIAMVIGHLIGIYREKSDKTEMVFFDSPLSFRAAFAMSTILLIIYVFAPTDSNPFIYFQF